MKIKAGLEIHIQLDTEEKLFCKCKTTMTEEKPSKIVKRKLHPIVGELGLVDVAAQYEYLREREYYYEYFENESCLVELDEEPPRLINEDALKLSLQVALLLNCKIPDKIQVMRKTVIDGSNTSGFQRTALIGFDGYLEVLNKKIEIKTVCLEEDACAIDKEENGKIYYKLNRLGIPLIEISTAIFEVENYKEIEEVAFNIGWLVKSIKKVKRGIGSIRQDVNISINSARMELKGVQKLEDIPKIVDYEVKRLIDLEKIVEEMRKRNVKVSETIDLTNYFEKCDSELIRKFLCNGNKIFGLIFYNLGGLMNLKVSGRTFGKEISDYLKSFNSGIIHSEEDLEKYKLKKYFEFLAKEYKLSEKDVLAIFAAKNEAPIEFIKNKLERWINFGIENETRKVNKDLSTSFLRPLPGSARMYPETDLPIISLSRDFIEKIKPNILPLNVLVNEISKKYNIDRNVIKEIARAELLDFFKEFLEKYKTLNPNFLSQVFLLLKKIGFDSEIFKNKKQEIEKIFEYIRDRKISKNAIEEILEDLKYKKVDEIICEKNLFAFSKEELKNLLKDMGIKTEKDLKKIYSNQELRKRIVTEILEEAMKEI